MKTMNRFSLVVVLAVACVVGLGDAAAQTTNALFQDTFSSAGSTNNWMNDGNNFFAPTVVDGKLQLQQKTATAGRAIPWAASNYWTLLNTNVALSYGFSFDVIRTNTASSYYIANAEWQGSNYDNLVRIQYLQSSGQDTIGVYVRQGGNSKTLFTYNNGNQFNTAGSNNNYTVIFEQTGMRLILRRNSEPALTNLFFDYSNTSYFFAGTTVGTFSGVGNAQGYDGTLWLQGTFSEARNTDQFYYYDNVNVFQIVPVPEPSTLVAMTLGVGMLAWLRRRRA